MPVNYWKLFSEGCPCKSECNLMVILVIQFYPWQAHKSSFSLKDKILAEFDHLWYKISSARSY